MKCYYPRCTFTGTQAEVDDHLANTRQSDTDHDWPDDWDTALPHQKALAPDETEE